MLIYIYDELKAISNQKYPDQVKKQRKFERDVICANKDIVGRTERRLKTSSERILCIIDTGFSFDQIVKVGMNVSDFEVENEFYNQFLLALDLKSLNRSTGSLLDPTTVQPIIPKLKNLSLLEISGEIETELDDENEDPAENDEMELDR